MYQILFQIGSVSIMTNHVLIALGLFISLWIFGRLAQKNRLRLQFILDIGLRLIAGAIIGGRLFAIISNYQFYFNKINFHTITRLFAIWDKDLSFWGAIFGIGFILVKNCQVRDENPKKWGDIFMISLMTMLIFRNFGAFLDGANAGKPTESFLGMTFNSSNVLYTVPIHPTQLYATIYSALILAILYLVFKKYKNQFEGLVFLLGATIYSFFRFLEGFFRGDDVVTIFGSIRLPQLIFLLLFLYFSKKLYNYQVKNQVPFLKVYEKFYGMSTKVFKRSKRK